MVFTIIKFNKTYSTISQIISQIKLDQDTEVCYLCFKLSDIFSFPLLLIIAAFTCLFCFGFGVRQGGPDWM